MVELLVVVMIVAILSVAGMTHYAAMVERGRVSEAKAFLAQIRTAYGNFFLDHQKKAQNLDDLVEEDEGKAEDLSSCSESRFYRYDLSDPLVIATRCTKAGKNPQGKKSYMITIDLATGKWGGEAGMY